MAEIVFAAGVAHNPFFPKQIENGAPGADDLVRLYREITDRLVEAQPETIVFFTTDHYNAFFEVCVPIFSICTAERTTGPCDYGPEQLRQYDDVPLDPELAHHLQTQLVAAEFDVCNSQEVALDHTIIAPLSLMIPELEIPLVPFFVSGSFRPIPTAHRCRRLGEAVREVLEHSGIERRVALLCSGAFSFEVGGPRMSETMHVGVPAPRFAQRVTELLARGALDELVELTTPDQLVRAGNAAGEILNWIAVAGAVGPVPASFIELQPEHGHAFAAWEL